MAECEIFVLIILDWTINERFKIKYSEETFFNFIFNYIFIFSDLTEAREIFQFGARSIVIGNREWFVGHYSAHPNLCNAIKSRSLLFFIDMIFSKLLVVFDTSIFVYLLIVMGFDLGSIDISDACK